MSPLLGLDYGLSRIGIAVSDATDTIASPLATHQEARDGSILARLRELVRERGITAVVVGLPLTTRGEDAAMAARARSFARRVGEELGLPVHLVDERFSSREATGLLRLGGRRRRPKEEVDALAAALILQQFLDASPSPPDAGGRA
jgi:putative Holliday junction resolvase